jgi:hypothetical protein
MDLSQVSTKELVGELTKRKGVTEYAAGPDDNFEIKVNETATTSKGPARILHVFD